MLASTVRKVQYDKGAGWVGPYPVTFRYFAKSEVVVVLSFDDAGVTPDSTLILDTDYTLTDPGASGTLTLVSVWDTDAVRVTIYRDMDMVQETDYVTGQAIAADTLETDFDLAAARDQEVEEPLARTIRAPISDDNPIMTLPGATERAGGYLGFNDDGDAIVVTGVLPDDVVTSAYGELIVAIADAAALLALLGLTANTRNTALGISALAGTTTDNVAVGYHALDAATTGSQNVAVGVDALGANTTGADNVAIGFNALLLNTTGASNVAIGSGALDANTVGIQNTAVGSDALGANTTGKRNVAVGFSALLVNTTGVDNVSVGMETLAANTVGTANTAVGHHALYANTTGTSNTALGYGALFTNTTGISNTAAGWSALLLNTTGVANTAVGYGALSANTVGIRNVAVGSDALGANTTGGSNVAVGWDALLANTTGTLNTAIGVAAGDAITTGTNNVVIGANADASGAGALNEVSIYSGTQYARFQSSAGAWSWVSDERDKIEIRDSVLGLDFLKLVPVKDYRWNERIRYKDAKRMADGVLARSERIVGFTAQSLDKAVGDSLPGLVVKTDPEQWTVADTKLIPVMVNAIKELDARLAKMEAA